MREIKQLFDPDRLLNPGVILSDDATRPPARPKSRCRIADAIVDKCIECGFCEPVCPSAGLTLSPRQRITSWREIQRRQAAGEGGRWAARCLRLRRHRYLRRLRTVRDRLPGRHRNRQASSRRCAPTRRRRSRAQSGAVLRRTSARPPAQCGSGCVRPTRCMAALGTDRMARVTGTARTAVRRAAAEVDRGAAARRFARAREHAKWPGGERVVYFPSCAARTMAPPRGDDASEPLTVVTERVLQRAGYARRDRRAASTRSVADSRSTARGTCKVQRRWPKRSSERCVDASEGGALPIVFDTSPCAYRMQQTLAGRLRVHDLTEFLHDQVLPRLTSLRPLGRSWWHVHPVCSVTKMGLQHKLAGDRPRVCAAPSSCRRASVAVAGLATVDSRCRNSIAHALRRSQDRNCPPPALQAIQPAARAKSDSPCHSGIDYRSIVYLVDAASAERLAFRADRLRLTLDESIR
jgi:D-lactate dehydrogenase